MLHEAGMLDTACKSDLIVNGRVHNQSLAASLTAQELSTDHWALLPILMLLLAQHCDAACDLCS